MTASPRSRRLLRWFMWLIPVGLVWALYGRTLGLPLFWDDVPNFEFARTRTFVQIWSDVSGSPWYRPVLFTWWKLSTSLWPAGAVALHHALNVLVHAFNTVAVGGLALLVSRGRPAPAAGEHTPTRRQAWLVGFLAAVFFATFPFASVPTAMVGMVFHPAVTSGILISALAAARYALTRRQRWLALAIFMAWITPYIHESGVMAGTAAALTLLLLGDSRPRRDGWRAVLLAGVSASFFVVWLSVPKTHTSSGWEGWPSIFASFTFFAQSLTYPLQPIAGLLVPMLKGWWDVWVVWLVAAPALVVATAVLLDPTTRRAGLLVFVFGWHLAVILPGVAALPYSYIFLSMRMLYLPGVAGAILWAAVCAWPALRWPSPRGVALTGALALAVAGSAALFVNREVALHNVALRSVWLLTDIGRRYPDESHFLINGLDWLAYTDQIYPIGHEGVEVMPAYVTVGQLIELNSGVKLQIQDAQFDFVKTEMPGYYCAPHLSPNLDWAHLAAALPAYDRVWLEACAGDRVSLEEVGALRPGSVQKPARFLADFANTVYLTDADLHVEHLAALVTLSWKYLGPDPNATIFRHVFDCAGNVLGLGDGAALGQMVPFTYMPPGAEIRDVRRMALTDEAADGCYYLEIGLFRPDGSRVAVMAPDGSLMANNLVTIPGESQ